MTERGEGHHVFCSAAGWPCPIACEQWPESVTEMFPKMDVESALEIMPDKWWTTKRNGQEEE